jgi:putative ABC transport system permease protein
MSSRSDSRWALSIVIVRPVLLAAVRRVLAGVVLGVLISIAATRAVSSLLFGMGTLDATTYAGVLVLMVAVVAVAQYVPARRAADIDQIVLLRRQ